MGPRGRFLAYFEHSFVSTCDKHNVSIRRTIKTTTFPVMKEAILHGVGAGIFLDNSTTQEHTLVSIPIKEMSKSYETFIVVPKDKYNLRLIKSFVDSALEQ